MAEDSGARRTWRRSEWPFYTFLEASKAQRSEERPPIFPMHVIRTDLRRARGTSHMSAGRSWVVSARKRIADSIGQEWS